MMARAYHTSYKLPVIVTRGNNVYGPHQFPEKMIPKFIYRAQRGLELPIHGDGLATRSYLYVEDVADAYITVLLKVRACLFLFLFGGPGGSPWWLVAVLRCAANEASSLVAPRNLRLLAW
jgi:dTDP-D-glucose 4,6-dehydratase